MRSLAVPTLAPWLLALAGCAVSQASMNDPSARLESAEAKDAGPDEGDASEPATDAAVADTGIANPDAAAPEDAGSQDGGVAHDDAGTTAHDGGGTDAGTEPVARMLDGVISPREWDDALRAEQTATSTWSDANTLRSLSAVIENGALWLALAGTLEATNAWVVYIDSVPDAGTSPSALTDQTGALDDALSSIVTTAAPLAPDFAWGTRKLSVSPTGLDASTGFRRLEPLSDIAWIDSALAPTVCGVDACEARIPLTTLGGTGAISVFARLTNGTGKALSNQTLPVDAPAAPSSVGRVLVMARD